MNTQTITLITGGNRSLGLTAAQRLIAHGHTVYLGARDAAKGKEVADRIGARFVQLDVDSDESVLAAAEQLGQTAGKLDVLINNAGILGTHKPTEEISAADALPVFQTNVIGIVRVTHAFLPLLRKSDHPRIVNVSSGMGSLALIRDEERAESKFVSVLYSASKAAVVMLTAQYARGLPWARVNAADPGYTATDFNNHSGPQTLEEGTDAMVALALIPRSGPTGAFRDRVGDVRW